MKPASTFTFALLFVLFYVIGNAKQINPLWRSGQIHFWNKVVLEGDIAYNWSAEMVSLRELDGRVRTFSANQVAEFGWFDHEQHKRRNFVSLTKPLDNERTSQCFFEVCMDGPLTVVRRFRKPHGPFKRLFSHPANSSDQPTLAQDTDQFEYFVFDAGRLLTLNKFHAEIYEPLMTTYHQELRQYILTHNINDRVLAGRLLLIGRYNSMVQYDPKTASNKGFSGAND
ncbi:hypothetical protein [Spirosoma fluviale]|uniref:Uncharacterized protein n=1 Tax=Spirosoma fluviale TaxID=1597977 RepID=A0A286G898_9BACT|nr:hypothetical protein [Spirosoma fluviale]SOD91770.1 hypothetical protein SAMN06269250_3631 [Spirosoma fluviale]